MSAGIGEHSDITEAVMVELDKLAAANDRQKCWRNIFLVMIKCPFSLDKSPKMVIYLHYAILHTLPSGVINYLFVQ